VYINITEKHPQCTKSHTWTGDAGRVTEGELLANSRGRKTASAGLYACLPPVTAV
jgi:hypothetical protein